MTTAKEQWQAALQKRLDRHVEVCIEREDTDDLEFYATNEAAERLVALLNTASAGSLLVLTIGDEVFQFLKRRVIGVKFGAESLSGYSDRNYDESHVESIEQQALRPEHIRESDKYVTFR